MSIQYDDDDDDDDWKNSCVGNSRLNNAFDLCA